MDAFRVIICVHKMCTNLEAIIRWLEMLAETFSTDVCMRMCLQPSFLHEMMCTNQHRSLARDVSVVATFVLRCA